MAGHSQTKVTPELKNNSDYNFTIWFVLLKKPAKIASMDLSFRSENISAKWLLITLCLHNYKCEIQNELSEVHNVLFVVLNFILFNQAFDSFIQALYIFQRIESAG